jgi:hypothetical protein
MFIFPTTLPSPCPRIIPAVERLNMKLPQLSLRALFLLVVIVAMGCGWWVDRRFFSSKIDSMVRDAKEAERQATEREIEILSQLHGETGERRTFIVDPLFEARHHMRMDKIAERIKVLKAKEAALRP